MTRELPLEQDNSGFYIRIPGDLVDEFSLKTGDNLMVVPITDCYLKHKKILDYSLSNACEEIDPDLDMVILDKDNLEKM